MHSLSLPTWVIHVSSVVEWITAIGLIWVHGDQANRHHWKSLSWGMLPALISAMCACVWHFFDNAPSLEWLVVVQAATTFIGNSTMALAGWWIWKQSQQESLT